LSVLPRVLVPPPRSARRSSTLSALLLVLARRRESFLQDRSVQRLVLVSPSV